MELKVVIAGEEQMPSGATDRAEASRINDSNYFKMRELFQNYFGLDPSDCYMRCFPYDDKNTGQPRVEVVVSMSSHYMRDAIAACLRAAITEAGLVDIVVIKEDDDPEGRYKTSWLFTMVVVAMGPSVTDTLVGEQRIQAALVLLQAWLSRA